MIRKQIKNKLQLPKLYQSQHHSPNKSQNSESLHHSPYRTLKPILKLPQINDSIDYQQFSLNKSAVFEMSEKELIQIEDESMIQLVFGDLDSIQDQQKDQTFSLVEEWTDESFNNHDIIVLKDIEENTFFKLQFCYSRSNKKYQRWKKQKPQYTNGAVIEKKIVQKIISYKQKLKYSYLPKSNDLIQKSVQLSYLLAAVMEVNIVEPLVELGENFPSHQIVVFQGGICTLKEFSQLRLERQQDPFSTSEINYIFWFLIFSVYQLERSQIYHQKLCGDTITLNQIENSFELRIFNFSSESTTFHVEQDSPISQKIDNFSLLFEQIQAILSTILEIYGYQHNYLDFKKIQEKQYLRNQEEESDGSNLNKFMNQFVSLQGLKDNLMLIDRSKGPDIVVLHLEQIYPKEFINCKKKINDDGSLIKKFELDVWKRFFHEKGRKEFDINMLNELNLKQALLGIRIDQNETILLNEENNNILQVQDFLDPTVLPYTYQNFQKCLNEIKEERDAKKIIQSYLLLGDFYNQMGEIENAQGVVDKTIKFLDEVKGNNFYLQTQLEIYSKQMQYHHEMGQEYSAIKVYNRICDILPIIKYKNNDHIRYSINLIYCQILNKMGQIQQAIKELFDNIFDIEAKLINLKKLPSQQLSLQLATFYDTLSEIYEAKGKYDICLSYQEQSLTIKEEYLHNMHPDKIYSLLFMIRLIKVSKDNNFKVTLPFLMKSKDIKKQIHCLRSYFYAQLNELRVLYPQERICQQLTQNFRKRNLMDNSQDPIFRKTVIYQCFCMISRLCGKDSPQYQEELLRMVQVCYGIILNGFQVFNQLQEAKAFLLQIGETQSASLLKPLLYDQCQLFYEMRDFENGLVEINHLLQVFHFGEKESLEYEQALAMKSSILFELGYYEQAITIKEQCIGIKLNHYGQDHIEVRTAQKTLVTIKNNK